MESEIRISVGKRMGKKYMTMRKEGGKRGEMD